MVGFPIKFTEAPCEVRFPAPQLGEHETQILEEIGFSPAERAQLKQSGAMGPTAPVTCDEGGSPKKSATD
jgi:crotonobetainyl-CoA:carnitine CoA-transferase CaiB-like acyl-CoA transferase